MSMNAPGRKDSFGETLQDIWANKPFAITLFAGIGLLLYFVFKNGGLTAGQSAAPVDTSSLTPASNPAGMPLGNISNSYTNITSTTTNPVAPAPAPVPGTVPPTPTPTPTPKSAPGSPNGIPLIPYGQLPPGTRYSTAADLKAQPYLTWNNVQYLKVPGSNGLLWGVAGGVQYKLYGPASAYQQ